ncbi:MAG: hypothetical protein AB7O52_01615 [Planctomycetota bacterium]
MNRRELVSFLRENFALDWRGIHGAPHWARVRVNGLHLAKLNKANTRVVEAFALVHDSCRLNDGHDPEHGLRAGQLARRVNNRLLLLQKDELDQLVHACEGHSEGHVDADVTVQTCWDADRLDLGRVGIRPSPNRLCTAAARDPIVIAWAFARSVANEA